MHFPFRRSAPAAWASRLPQFERGGGAPSSVRPLQVAPLEAGGGAVALTRPALPSTLTARDIAADPAGAERLPPQALVGAVLAVEAENRALRSRLRVRKQELDELRAGMADHALEDAEMRGRLNTLEDVISALHANLEDLRLQRDQLLADAR